MFENGRQAVRMNYYPACENGSNVMGITPHTDASGLTLLLQVNEVQGLQIKRNPWCIHCQHWRHYRGN